MRAFGKFDPGEPLALRGFEEYFGIPQRDGPGAWKSSYPSVQKLLNHLARQSRSEGSRESYLNVLKQFCWNTSFSPDDLITLSKKQIEAFLQGYIDSKNAEKKSRTYLNMTLKRLRTFFRVNGIDDLEVHGFYQPTRYRKRPEYIPTKNEIYGMANAAESPRDRAIILCLWSSGLRVSTFCALNYGDVKDDVKSENQVVRFPVYPEMKEKVPDACKGEIPYYSFICAEASEALRVYLRKRSEDFGPVQGDDPLFHSDWHMWEREVRPSKRLGRRGVGLIVKKAARLSGLKEWVNVTSHSLRKAFESVLRSQLVDGSRLDKGTQEFLFGHILPGSQDVYYDKTKVEFHRDEYGRLDFSESSLARVMDRLIPLSDLESYFGDGWVFVSKVSDDKVVVRRSV